MYLSLLINKMFKIIVFIILFDLYIFNENNSDILYEIELPNDENNQNFQKVLKIFKNENNISFNLSINYKFENEFSNKFSLDANEILDVLSCMISQKCDNTNKVYVNDNEIFVKYYENGIIPICIYKQKVNDTSNGRYFNAICLDRSEYKRFINIVAYLLNVIEFKNE